MKTVYGEYLGTTTDNCHRNVDVYAKNNMFLAVYDKGLDTEVISEESIQNVQMNPDDFIYTPYIEFVNCI